jgi:hypothetical protein
MLPPRFGRAEARSSKWSGSSRAEELARARFSGADLVAPLAARST